MQHEQKTQPAKPTIQIDIKMPIQLLRLLVTENRNRNKRFTKAQAFRFLVDSYELSTYTDNPKIAELSISSLARAWNWNRETTKNFLCALEKLQVVNLTQQGRKTVARFSENILLAKIRTSAKEGLDSHSYPTKQETALRISPDLL